MPEKVKQRKSELSTQEFACSQAPAPDEPDDEEAVPLSGRAHEPVQQTGSFNAWTAVPKPIPGAMNKKRGPLNAWFERDEAGAKQSTVTGRGGAKKPKLTPSTFNLSTSLACSWTRPTVEPFSFLKVVIEGDEEAI
jgi:hypothetical protein